MSKQPFGCYEVHSGSFSFVSYTNFNCHFCFMFIIILIFSVPKFINFPIAIP